jgi:hypothetical protein
MEKYQRGDIVKLTNGTTGKIVRAEGDSYRFMADDEELSYLVKEQDIDPKFSCIQYFDPTFDPTE